MLRSMSRLVNIEKSLNHYLNSQLVTLYGYTVIFPRRRGPTRRCPADGLRSYIPNGGGIPRGWSM